MKKIIILTSLALSIISCSRETVVESYNNRLSFDVVLNNAPGTKAESMELYSKEGRTTSFTLERVLETKSVQINHGVTFTEIYDSFQVEGRENGSRKFYDYAHYNPATGLWDLQNSTYIWRPGHEIEVIAAASGRDNEQFFNGITYNGNPSTASFNYSLPDTHASQQDYLIGYYKGEIASGTVSLKFNHPLTSLVFKVGPLPLGVSLQVNSITLEGIDAEAICDVTFGENSTYTWRDHSGRKDYTQVIENATPQGEGEDILDETASFIVIPRVFPANSEARILLSITENGREYDMYAPLAGQTWAPGETNIYEISYHGDNKAVLIDGPSFNNALADLTGSIPGQSINIWSTTIRYTAIPNITKIVFETLSNNTTGIPVNVPGERPIYMKYDGSTITITTDDFAFYTGNDASSMFAGLTNLHTIEGLDKIETKETKSMAGMFQLCRNLQSIDLHNFNTEKVEMINGMFQVCDKLQSIDLSSFKTDNIINAGGLFGYDSQLRSIIWGDHFQLKKCTVIAHSFTFTGLTDLDLSFILGSEEGIDIAFLASWSSDVQSINIENLRGPITRSWDAFCSCTRLQNINFGSYQTLQYLGKKTAMFDQTASGIGGNKCIITCTQEAKNVMTTGDTYINPALFDWNIVPYTPYE